MENFFETQLKKIIGGNPGLAKLQATYVGRSCYLTLDDNRRAKIEIKEYGTHEKYERISITILSANSGVIDTADILFKDRFAEQKLAQGGTASPLIWMYRRVEWYKEPTRSEWIELSDTVFEYVSLFK